MSIDTAKISTRFSARALVSLVDAYPNPDDPDGDWGPLGPVIRQMMDAMRQHGIPMAGPTPEPWRSASPHPEPWRTAGPQPEPWRMGNSRMQSYRTAMIARSMVERVYNLSLLAEEGQMSGRVSQLISDVIDDWCGTPPRWPKWPVGPYPGPWWNEMNQDLMAPRPVDLMIAAVEISRAAQNLGGTALAGELDRAAERLAQTGMAGM